MAPPDLAKVAEIHAFPAWQEKIRTQKSYGYWETLINLYEYEGFRQSGSMAADPLPHESALRPKGTIWNPLQFLGFLKTCHCRSAVGWGRTPAPALKSYGYWEPLIEPMESNGFQHGV